MWLAILGETVPALGQATTKSQAGQHPLLGPFLPTCLMGNTEHSLSESRLEALALEQTGRLHQWRA